MYNQLHVADAAQIVKQALPEQLKKDATFKKYYLDRAPIPDGTYAEMIPKGISAIVRSVFNQLWNAKVANDGRVTTATHENVTQVR